MRGRITLVGVALAATSVLSTTSPAFADGVTAGGGDALAQNRAALPFASKLSETAPTSAAADRPRRQPNTVRTIGTFVSDDGKVVVPLTPEKASKLRPVEGVPAIGGGGPQLWNVNGGTFTGTVYFNKKETGALRAASAVSAFANLLPPPFGTIISINAARISLTAAAAVYQGRCLQIKTNAYIGTYSGAWCSGSY